MIASAPSFKFVLRIALLFLALSGVSVFAQPPGGPPPGMGGPGGPTINIKKFNADKELSRLTKKYKLTEDQQSKIRPILQDQYAKVFALGENPDLSDTDYVASVRATHRQTVAKVKLEMTDTQANKYLLDEEKAAKDDAEQDQQQGRPDGPPPGGGGGPPGGGGGGPPGE